LAGWLKDPSGSSELNCDSACVCVCQDIATTIEHTGDPYKQAYDSYRLIMLSTS